MGTGKYKPKKNLHSKKKGFKKYFLSTKHRRRDIDQIQDDIRKRIEKAEKGEVDLEKPVFEYDVELPGGGQFYCIETGRHFQTQKALDDHKKTKFFRKRVKVLQSEKQYSQQEANLHAGVTKEKLPPAHNDMSIPNSNANSTSTSTKMEV